MAGRAPRDSRRKVRGCHKAVAMVRRTIRRSATLTPRKPIRFKDCGECSASYRLLNTLSQYCSRPCRLRAWSKRHPGYMVDAQRRLLKKPEKLEQRRRRMQIYNQRGDVIARRKELCRRKRAANPLHYQALARARRDGYRIGHTVAEWRAKLVLYGHRC